MSKETPFITFEGGEGSGKTTQIKLLAEWLRTTGKEVVVTREPGGTPGGDAIRKLLVEGEQNRWDMQTDTLLFMASRRHNLVQVVWPALEKKQWVLSDRFMDSTYAYQCFGRGLDRAGVRDLYRFVAGDFLPDLTLFLDIDVELGLERATKGQNRALHENRYEGFDLSFHHKLRQGYQTLAAEEPNRMVTVDASGDVDTVQQRLRQIITQRFLT